MWPSEGKILTHQKCAGMQVLCLGHLHQRYRLNAQTIWNILLGKKGKKYKYLYETVFNTAFLFHFLLYRRASLWGNLRFLRRFDFSFVSPAPPRFSWVKTRKTINLYSPVSLPKRFQFWRENKKIKRTFTLCFSFFGKSSPREKIEASRPPSPKRIFPHFFSLSRVCMWKWEFFLLVLVLRREKEREEKLGATFHARREREKEGGLSNQSCQFRLGFAEFIPNSNKIILDKPETVFYCHVLFFKKEVVYFVFLLVNSVPNSVPKRTDGRRKKGEGELPLCAPAQ